MRWLSTSTTPLPEVRLQLQVVLERVLLEERDDLVAELRGELRPTSEIGRPVSSSRNEWPICFSRPSILAMRSLRIAEEQRRDPGRRRRPPSSRLGVRHQLDEREPPAKGGVKQPDRAVGRVHRAEDVDVRRDVERLAALRAASTVRPRLSRSSSVISSPKIFGMLPRLISSISSRNGLSGLARAARQTRLKTPSSRRRSSVAGAGRLTGLYPSTKSSYVYEGWKVTRVRWPTSLSAVGRQVGQRSGHAPRATRGGSRASSRVSANSVPWLRNCGSARFAPSSVVRAHLVLGRAVRDLVNGLSVIFWLAVGVRGVPRRSVATATIRLSGSPGSRRRGRPAQQRVVPLEPSVIDSRRTSP